MENDDEHQDNESKEDKSADAGCDNGSDSYDVSSTTDKKYGTQTREKMRSRKRKSDLSLKLPIHPTINSKQYNILHASTMVQTMGNTHLDLRDYTILHATIHCGPNRQENVMHNPLVTAILTQYHVSKGLEVFVEPDVAATLKEPNKLHDRMIMDPKNAENMTMCQKKAALQYLM